MGFATVEYTASALVDLAFHNGPAPADPPMQKQAEVLEARYAERYRMRHANPPVCAYIFRGRLFLGLLQLHVVRSHGCGRVRGVSRSWRRIR